jgi:uncharacterized protein
VKKLTEAGHAVRVLTRDSSAALRKLRYPNVKVYQPADWKTAIPGSDAVVNLAGEPIATRCAAHHLTPAGWPAVHGMHKHGSTCRWNEQIKTQIMNSRVGTTQTLVECINATPKESRPKARSSSRHA